MARPKPTEEDKERRARRRTEWVEFRKEYLFTQKRLAEILGISRRTVQQIEAGLVTPLPQTLRNFLALKARYGSGKAA